ncbi:aspartate kinase [Streptomyces puniciscabiei]|uniref:amino acid kinase family protein n=1 Tax=Streptomyces puniciscabiei TaxID=164348 RepID=UPI0037987617
MSLHVLKFGGSTFPSTHQYRSIARYLRRRMARGEQLVIVASGMQGATENLRSLATSIDPGVGTAALHGVLPLADTTGAGLLRIGLEREGVPATLLHGHRTGLVTEAVEDRAAPLLRTELGEIEDLLDRGITPVLPGGQGADDQHRPTWLGKNSSDLSAVALAGALGLPEVEIFSDVEGVYSADPYIIDAARPMPRIGYEEMITLAGHGAKVLHPQAVRTAQRHGVRIVCRLNYGDFTSGSVIGDTGGVRAVVVDLRSVVASFPDVATADAAYERLLAEGAQAHRPQVPGRHLAAVTGGFFDVGRALADAGLPVSIGSERLVTAVRDGVATIHVADDEQAARRLGAELHDELTTAQAGREREALVRA